MKTIWLNSGGAGAAHIAALFSEREHHSLHVVAAADPDRKALAAEELAQSLAVSHNVVKVSQSVVTPLTLVGLGLSYAHVMGAGQVLWGLMDDAFPADYGNLVRYLVDLRYPKHLIATDVPMRDLRDLLGVVTRNQIPNVGYRETLPGPPTLTGRPNVAVFLNGGGLDSLLTAKAYHGRGWCLHSLYVHYGDVSQDREDASAARIAARYCAGHTTARLSVDWLYQRRTPESAHRGLVSARPVFLGTAEVLCWEKNVDTILWNAGFAATVPNYASVASRVLHPIKVLNSDMPDSTLTDVWRMKAMEYGVTREEAEDTCSCTFATPCGLCFKCKTRQRLELSREAS